MRSLWRQYGKQRSVIYFLVHALMIMVGVVFTMVGGSLWVAIGTGLVATGVAGFMTYLYVSTTQGEAKKVNNFDRAGIEWIYTARAAQIRSEYDTRLTSARKCIDIMGIGLSDFARDYMSKLGEMSVHAPIRILLLDPDGDLPNRKDLEEGRSEERTRSEIRDFISKFHEIYGRGNSRLAVRTYTCLPNINIFRIDDSLFWGPYLAGRESANTLTVRTSSSGDIFSQLNEHFDIVWGRHSKQLEDPSDG